MPKPSLETAFVNRPAIFPYHCDVTDLTAPGRFQEITAARGHIILPAATVETDQTMVVTLQRGSDNDDQEQLGVKIEGHGGKILYTGADWALKNTDLGNSFRRMAARIEGLTVEVTAAAKGGIRLFNVHHSRIDQCNVWGNRNGFSFFLDAFGDSTGENSQGGANQNLFLNCKAGRDLQPFSGAGEDELDLTGAIKAGFVIAGSRGQRAAAGQNTIIGCKVFNFTDYGAIFSGIAPTEDPLNPTYFPPKPGYRDAEGAVGNYLHGFTAVCQRTLTSCFYSAKGVEKADGDKTQPPVAIYYDARNGLTIRDSHIEKCGIPVLVSHGADRELCMPTGNQLTNSGFPDGQGGVANGFNINMPVVERYPHPDSGTAELTTLDVINYDHYKDGDALIQSMGGATWSALADSAQVNENIADMTTVADIETALRQRKGQRILPLVDYDGLRVGG